MLMELFIDINNKNKIFVLFFDFAQTRNHYKIPIYCSSSGSNKKFYNL